MKNKVIKLFNKFEILLEIDTKFNRKAIVLFPSIILFWNADNERRFDISFLWLIFGFSLCFRY